MPDVIQVQSMRLILSCGEVLLERSLGIPARLRRSPAPCSLPISVGARAEQAPVGDRPGVVRHHGARKGKHKQ